MSREVGGSSQGAEDSGDSRRSWYTTEDREGGGQDPGLARRVGGIVIGQRGRRRQSGREGGGGTSRTLCVVSMAAVSGGCCSSSSKIGSILVIPELRSSPGSMGPSAPMVCTGRKLVRSGCSGGITMGSISTCGTSGSGHMICTSAFSSAHRSAGDTSSKRAMSPLWSATTRVSAFVYASLRLSCTGSVGMSGCGRSASSSSRSSLCE